MTPQAARLLNVLADHPAGEWLTAYDLDVAVPPADRSAYAAREHVGSTGHRYSRVLGIVYQARLYLPKGSIASGPREAEGGPRYRLTHTGRAWLADRPL